MLKSAQTASNGRYSVDFTSARNIRGGDSIEVTWTSGAGDIVHDNAHAPYMVAWVRNPLFEATVSDFQASTFALRSSGGTLRSTLSRIGDEDGQIEQAYWSTSAGSLIPTVVGDRMTASFASDAAFTIPNLPFSINTGGDVVSGTCLSNRRYWIEIRDPGGGTYRIGNAGPTGAFSEDFTTGSPYDILEGDVVTVHCMFGTGDQVARRARAG